MELHSRIHPSTPFPHPLQLETVGFHLPLPKGRRRTRARTSKVGKWAGGKVGFLALLTFTLSHLLTFAAAAASVTLAWDPSPSAGVSDYVVHQATGTNAFAPVLSVGTNLTATIPGLSAGAYQFRVTAKGPDGQESDPSNSVTAEVVESMPIPPLPPTPAKPVLFPPVTAFDASSATYALTLAWSPTLEATKYLVRLAATNFVPKVWSSGTNTSLTISNLPPGDYRAAVMARTATTNLISDDQFISLATPPPPAPPSNLQVIP